MEHLNDQNNSNSEHEQLRKPHTNQYITWRLQLRRTFTLVCKFNILLSTAESQTQKLLRASEDTASVIHQPWISSVCSFHCLRGKLIQEICESTTTGGTAVAQLTGALRHNMKGDLFFCPFSVVLGSTHTPKSNIEFPLG